MDLRRLSRRMRPVIALSAAYALALQMLLTVAVAGQHAAAAASAPGLGASLCFGSGIDPADPASPPRQSPCSICVIAASDTGPVLAAFAAPERAYGAAFAPVSIPGAGPLALNSPRLSQGPPRIA